MEFWMTLLHYVCCKLHQHLPSEKCHIQMLRSRNLDLLECLLLLLHPVLHHSFHCLEMNIVELDLLVQTVVNDVQLQCTATSVSLHVAVIMILVTLCLGVNAQIVRLGK